MPERRKPAVPMTGGCACGAIRYEIGAFPVLLYACHCTDCQRQSGSSFALNLPVLTESFRFTSGQPKPWHRVTPSGARTISWFCEQCGGRIHGSRDGRPDTINVRAGTLDDTSWLEPFAHIYRRSAQPWELFLASWSCFETAPDDFAPLVARWRAYWDS